MIVGLKQIPTKKSEKNRKTLSVNPNISMNMDPTMFLKREKNKVLFLCNTRLDTTLCFVLK